MAEKDDDLLHRCRENDLVVKIYNHFRGGFSVDLIIAFLQRILDFAQQTVADETVELFTVVLPG